MRLQPLTNVVSSFVGAVRTSFSPGKRARRRKGHQPVSGEVLETRVVLSSVTVEGGAIVDGDAVDLVVTVDNPENHLVSPGTGFDGVAQMRVGLPGGKYENQCTSALLTTGRHLLTAAHCVTDGSGAFNADGIRILFPDSNGQIGYTERSAKHIFVHPEWNGDARRGNDLAIIELTTPAPSHADQYELYRDGNEIGSEFTLVGYGHRGQGEKGSVPGSYGELRVGENSYDMLQSLTGYFSRRDSEQPLLAYDFDNGSPANDAFGVNAGVKHVGLGDDEATAAKGDSGGPNFINGQIAGVTSYGTHFRNADVDGDINSSYGEVSVNTRVSVFADWIDRTISEPALLLDGVDGGSGSNWVNVTNDRALDVTFSNLPEGAQSIRTRVNSAAFTEWRDFDPEIPLEVTLPNWTRSPNWVKAEIRFDDGRVKSLYEPIRLAKPKVQLDAGAAITNTGNVELEFDHVSRDVERMRIYINGRSQGDWTAYSPKTQLRVNWYGDNWIAVDLEYADGSVRRAYQSIRLAKPELDINKGASLTNNRNIELVVENLAPNAEQVRFSINGTAYGEWLAANQQHQLRLNWVGDNWVRAEIQYKDGSVRQAYRRIRLADPKLELNGGQSHTNLAGIKTSFSNLAPDTVRVRYSINGGRYGAWMNGAGHSLKLNWKGDNWIRAEIQYADGSIRRVYQKIRFSDPELRINGGASSTSERDVTATLHGIADDAVRVRYGFTYGVYGAWEQFATTRQLRLRGGAGAKWVNVEIEYSDGRIRHAYQRIDFT